MMKNDAGRVGLWNWLNCEEFNLDDDQTSRILADFLSFKENRELTRAITLNDNHLT